MIRAVADTNVVVSAALTQSGPPSLVLELVNDGLIQLYIFPAVLAEYEEVLGRLRVGVLPLRARAMLKQLKRISRIVAPAKQVRVSTDQDDDIFLECAEAARAHYLITGNRAISQRDGSTPKRSLPDSSLSSLDARLTRLTTSREGSSLQRA